MIPRSPVRTLLAFALFAAASLAPSVAVPAAPPAREGATVTRGVGRMRTDGASDWSQASPGTFISPKTVVEASGGVPLELKYPDGVELTMEPGAFGKFMPANRLPAENNGWARGYHVELRGGEVDVRMPSEPRGGRAFLVSTSAGTLTDWRGSVHLTIDGDTVAAAIYEGALVVGSNGQGFAVYDKTGVFLKKGVNPERSRIIPGAPKWSAPSAGQIAPSFAVVRADEKPTLGFAWDAVEGATFYRVEVATDQGMANVIKRGLTGETRFMIDDASASGGATGGTSASRFYARVRAISNDKIVGGWSAPRALRVLRVTYPQGAFASKDGAVILPENASVVLGDVAGLEMALETFEGARSRVPVKLFWSPAAQSVRLGEKGSRVVHLRDPALGAETEIVLGRRELRADVTMCPTRARWPEHPVGVRVLLVDPSGRIDASCEVVTMDTTVNLTPVNVEWHHVGAWWWAQVPPQQGLGPWVVRVTARDKSGAEIGHGFLEVEGAAPPPKPGTRIDDSTEVRVTH